MLYIFITVSSFSFQISGATILLLWSLKKCDKRIKENSKVKTFVNVFGYIPMFASRRHLVNNYLKTFDLTDNSDINYISKEGNSSRPIFYLLLFFTINKEFCQIGLRE